MGILPDDQREPSQNTRAAYAADWAHFARWCRIRGDTPLPPSPDLISVYLSELASPSSGSSPLSHSTISRRLAGLRWNYSKRGFALDRWDPRIAATLETIRGQSTHQPQRKAAILRGDIVAMAAALPFDLRGMRDRAILLLGFEGGLGRSEIVCLDARRNDTAPSRGWVELSEAGALIVLSTRSGRREVVVYRGSSDRTCPVRALEHWLHFARIDSGPVFVRTSRDGTRALRERLNDKHVARLIKRTVLAAGVRADLPEKERLNLFSGQSLRTGHGVTTE